MVDRDAASAFRAPISRGTVAGFVADDGHPGNTEEGSLGRENRLVFTMGLSSGLSQIPIYRVTFSMRFVTHLTISAARQGR